MMILRSLSISRGYLKDAPLTGTVVFKTDHGEVTLNLTEEDCRPILEHCAEAVIASSKRVAECLTREAMSSVAIEHKPEDPDGSD